MDMLKELYAHIGVKRFASIPEIQQCCQTSRDELAKQMKLHPENKEIYESQIKTLKASCAVLSDPNQKECYDQALKPASDVNKLPAQVDGNNITLDFGPWEVPKPEGWDAVTLAEKHSHGNNEDEKAD